MRTYVVLLFLLGSVSLGLAQSEALAKQYFDKGEFQKALVSYERLLANEPRNTEFFKKLLDCYQQLEQYDKAEALLQNRILTMRYAPQYLVDMGYNYRLQGREAEAAAYFRNALEMVLENPSFGSQVGRSFQEYSMLDEAIEAYTTAMELDPSLNYNFALARIYGEKGDIEKMYDYLLNLIIVNPAYVSNVQQNLSQFITEDPEDTNNVLLRKTLLRKLQEQPDLTWNEMLSWLFIQQKDYNKAFAQEKAIYLRNVEGTSMQRMMDLAIIAKDNEDHEAAQQVLGYMIQESSDVSITLWAHENSLSITMEEAPMEEYPQIHLQFQSIFRRYGIGVPTLSLQLLYAQFLAFQNDQPQQAIDQLNTLLSENRWNNYQEALIKMSLADILVYDEKFNQALIRYSQIQKDLKNDVIGQKARFKVAQTSYYKGDFEWAEAQLKVLKSSTSQLIANDALQLKLLISDNAFEDSTLTALKLYAKADLLAYQNKDKEAIALLEVVLTEHKGKAIEDEALLEQGRLYEKLGEYEKARFNYLKVIEFYGDGILIDDAYYALGELHRDHFKDTETARSYYERIIFDHPDSIYFVEARKKYRRLRGDMIN